MKTISGFLSALAILSVFNFSCQKELSFEEGNTTRSDGILQADLTGTCTGVTLAGTYKVDSALNSSHYVEVTVIVNSEGSYTITTDTINGYYFRGAGNFTNSGTHLVRLSGNGKPLATGINSFTVSYDSTECEFSVTVLPGSGGTAVFTPEGYPNACNNATSNGNYSLGTPLNSSNNVILNVNVTTAGTYSVTTDPVNGMVFSGSGSFASTGVQTITITGSGTPVATGLFTIAFTAGTSTCTFNISVGGDADYYPRTVNSNWSYDFDGDFNDSLLRKVIPQTITISGNTYNIFMVTNDASAGFDTSGYYRRSGSDYLEWIDMGIYLGYDSSIWMEYVFLKDNLPQGGTWNSAQFTGPVTPSPGDPPVQVTGRLSYKILQKDISVTVKGVSYPNTIVVEERLWIYDASTSTWIDASSQTGYFINYYSRNIGWIKQEYIDGGLIYPFELRRYAVY